MITDLLTHPEGQELYRVPVPPELVDQSARHALEVLKDVHDSLLVGVFVDGSCLLNPPSNTVLARRRRAPRRSRPAHRRTRDPYTASPTTWRSSPTASNRAPRARRASRSSARAWPGLVAASELLRAGHDPILLEAQHRVGGRVLTLREPFAHGLVGGGRCDAHPTLAQRSPTR